MNVRPLAAAGQVAGQHLGNGPDVDVVGVRGVEGHRFHQHDRLGGLVFRKHRQGLHRALAFGGADCCGAGILALLRQRQRQELARRRRHPSRSRRAPCARRAAPSLRMPVVSAFSIRAFALIGKPDERFADRKLHHGVAGARSAAERERAGLQIGGELAGFLHPPAIRRGEHANGDHVHFVTPAAHRGGLLRPQAPCRRSARRLGTGRYGRWSSPEA